MQDQLIWNQDVLEFAIFCIESLAAYSGKNAQTVYRALKDSDILYSCIIANYDILHTQGKEYLMPDIGELMQRKGVTV